MEVVRAVSNEVFKSIHDGNAWRHGEG